MTTTWKSKKIIIACSGWADSMYLLWSALNEMKWVEVIATHYNHNLRWEESIRDEEFVKEYCISNWIKLEIWWSDIKSFSTTQKIWIEEAARIRRYEFLEQIREKYGADEICTAHHLDDNIETFLFNLIRGSKLAWLSWIQETSWYLKRPLLHVSKSEILDNCRKFNIPYIEDSTNSDDNFLRNHIRLNIVPNFSKINPDFRNAFDSTITYFKDLNCFLEDNVKQIINWRDFILEKEFKSLNEFMKKELLVHLYKQANLWTIWLSEGNLQELIRFTEESRWWSIKEIKLLRLRKEKWKIYFNTNIKKW